MNEICISLKYRELCSIKHALARQINVKNKRKEAILFNSEVEAEIEVEVNRLNKEILEEKKTCEELEKLISSNKQ